MRKRRIQPGSTRAAAVEEGWLDLEDLAVAEVSSELDGWPIEAALGIGNGFGWKADGPGEQTVRLVFETPQRLHRVFLAFQEPEAHRTQEFVLRVSPDGRSFQDVVRQQFHFSPPGTTWERETYELGNREVAVLELVIVPDIGGGPTRASLTEMRVA